MRCDNNVSMERYASMQNYNIVFFIGPVADRMDISVYNFSYGGKSFELHTQNN